MACRNYQNYIFVILTIVCVYILSLKINRYSRTHGTFHLSFNALKYEEQEFISAMEDKHRKHRISSEYKFIQHRFRPKTGLELAEEEFQRAMESNSKVIVKPTTIQTPTKKVKVKMFKTKHKHPIVMEPVINNKGICKDTKIDLLVYVQSYWKNSDKRQLLRETWMKKNNLKDFTVKSVFIIGLPRTKEDQKKIADESAMHLDLVQGNFIDSFYNLTMKSIIALQWINENCIHARQILKVDDDVFVNVFRLFEIFIPRIQNMKKTVMCHVKRNSTSKIIRNPASKWHVPGNIFPGLTHFPTFCTGFFALFTMDLIPELYEKTFTAPYFGVDDVFVFGLLMGKVRGVVYDNISSNLTLNQKRGLDIFKNKPPHSHPVAVNAWNHNILKELWGLSISHLNAWGIAHANSKILEQ